MDEYVSQKEHGEFVKRIEAEHKRLEDEDNRQNSRLRVIEEKIDDLVDLTASIKSLTVEIQSMTKEIEKMGKRIEAMEKRDSEIQSMKEKIESTSAVVKEIEGRDGDKWRKVVWTVITVIVTAAVTYFTCHLGIG